MLIRCLKNPLLLKFNIYVTNKKTKSAFNDILRHFLFYFECLPKNPVPVRASWAFWFTARWQQHLKKIQKKTIHCIRSCPLPPKKTAPEIWTTLQGLLWLCSDLPAWISIGRRWRPWVEFWLQNLGKLSFFYLVKEKVPTGRSLRAERLLLLLILLGIAPSQATAKATTRQPRPILICPGGS